jgi:CTP-dependent riboflavin kinase
MFTIVGTVIEGVKHFTRGITAIQGIFRDAVGEELYLGTINVKLTGQYASMSILAAC